MNRIVKNEIEFIKFDNILFNLFKSFFMKIEILDIFSFIVYLLYLLLLIYYLQIKSFAGLILKSIKYLLYILTNINT